MANVVYFVEIPSPNGGVPKKVARFIPQPYVIGPGDPFGRQAPSRLAQRWELWELFALQQKMPVQIEPEMDTKCD